MNNIEIDYEKPCIYQLKHKESGKIYIGSAKNGLRIRLYRHKHRTNGCIKLKAAIQKYGFESFDHSILEYCDPKNIIEREQYYLDILQPFDERGYNIAINATSSMSGHKFSDDHRRKLGLVNKGLIRSEETKQKMSLAGMGHECSTETRRKIGSVNKNRIPSIETRKKMSISQTGRRHSEETKQKMRGRLCSDETRQKLSLINKGRKMSEESKQKMRDTKRAQFEAKIHSPQHL